VGGGVVWLNGEGKVVGYANGYPYLANLSTRTITIPVWLGFSLGRLNLGVIGTSKDNKAYLLSFTYPLNEPTLKRVPSQKTKEWKISFPSQTSGVGGVPGGGSDASMLRGLGGPGDTIISGTPDTQMSKEAFVRLFKFLKETPTLRTPEEILEALKEPGAPKFHEFSQFSSDVFLNFIKRVQKIELDIGDVNSSEQFKKSA
jgi:hypothetical protein